MTQWPRFEVFQQDKEGEPHRNAGSVHAPDAEMALLNARDVFVRRPYCHSLWVVPAECIVSKTAEELTTFAWPDEPVDPAASPRSYYVFQKTKQGTFATFVEYAGTVEAHSPLQALRIALQTYRDLQPFVWWVVPSRAVRKSEQQDVASMFEPALDKPFRHQTYFRIRALMRETRAARSQTPAEDES